MTYNKTNNQYFLFVRIFIMLFIILFVIPLLVDNYLKMFVPYEAPRGGAVLVSKNLYETMNYGDKFLYILKNIILSL